MNATEVKTSRGAASVRQLPATFVGLMFLDVVVLAVMLVTDKNLQNDFGATPPYFLHWYGVLVLAVVTGILAVLVLLGQGRSMPARTPGRSGRTTLMLGVVWIWLAILAMLAVVATYKQVGFTTADQFARYLFGVSAYPGAESYIPWLYDLTLGLFFLTAVVGTIALVQIRREGSRVATPGS
jgi:hypothetical protein